MDGQVRRPYRRPQHHAGGGRAGHLYPAPLVLQGPEGTEYVFGTTDAGRYLLAVLAESTDGRAYVITPGT